MIEWALTLQFFHKLVVPHRVSTLRRYAAYYLVIETCYCTATSNYDDAWLFANGTCMPRDLKSLPEESQVKA